jgi:hypothetical protein
MCPHNLVTSKRHQGEHTANATHNNSRIVYKGGAEADDDGQAHKGAGGRESKAILVSHDCNSWLIRIFWIMALFPNFTFKKTVAQKAAKRASKTSDEKKRDLESEKTRLANRTPEQLLQRQLKLFFVCTESSLVS